MKKFVIGLLLIITINIAAQPNPNPLPREGFGTTETILRAIIDKTTMSLRINVVDAIWKRVGSLIEPIDSNWRISYNILTDLPDFSSLFSAKVNIADSGSVFVTPKNLFDAIDNLGMADISEAADSSFLVTENGALVTKTRNEVSGILGIPNYKVYRALISQSGTNAPTVTILENTVGSIIWHYSDVGLYSAHSDSLDSQGFPIDRTFIVFTKDVNTSSAIYGIGNESGTIYIQLLDTNFEPRNGLLSKSFIEIIIYPL